MGKVTLEKARKLAKELGLNLRVVPLKIWRKGLEVELEHWDTVCDMRKIGHIVIDHLNEFGPEYYEKLEMMETRLEKEQRGKVWKVQKPGHSIVKCRKRP